jgi:hypothetical protein
MVAKFELEFDKLMIPIILDGLADVAVVPTGR